MDGPLFTYELPCIRKELPVAGRVDMQEKMAAAYTAVLKYDKWKKYPLFKR